MELMKNFSYIKAETSTTAHLQDLKYVIKKVEINNAFAFLNYIFPSYSLQIEIKNPSRVVKFT